MNNETYTIYRHFQRGGKEIVASELTLAEARSHCKDPESSSRTATSDELLALTERRGEWFDGYSED